MSISPSASSSAVTLPAQPGKSILKKPPPPQQSLFSLARLSKFISPNNPSNATTNVNGSVIAAGNAPGNGTAEAENHKTLKRAHFILPELTTVYLISTANPPSSPTVRDEKRVAEEREAERRRRVVRRGSVGSLRSDSASALSVSTNATGGEEWWSMEQVSSFYRECCEGREELPVPAIETALKRTSSISPRTLDLSGVPLSPSPSTPATLSDIFTIEWGLRKLLLRECDLDEHVLKPILHALLIPGTLSFLGVPSNRRMKSQAYRVLGAYLAKAKNLQFLDLAQNPLDKKAIEYIAAALPTAPAQGLLSLRLDECSLRSNALETLAHVVRTSSLRNISLRHNRINANGAVALALMIKDYPDAVPANTSINNAAHTHSPSITSSAASSVTNSPPTQHLPLPTQLSPPMSPTTPTTPIDSRWSKPTLPPPHQPPPAAATVTKGPPPKHPSQTPHGTTYTPYIPRSRRAVGPGAPPQHPSAPAAQGLNPLSASGQPVPVITTSGRGGVTTRHPVPPSPLSPTLSGGSGGSGNGVMTPTVGMGAGRGAGHEHHGPSAALLDKVRALDALPRLGALRTLDLRGNDIRTGVTYIAQVLKRNRTLKLLNLSENKIDVAGLVVLGEALKYNSSLETLDLSRNPCCGPALEGITSLRTAFTLNTSLKRLFLSSTGLSSNGAIALAEFLPESASLLHLDLTMNNGVGEAGVMALSGGLKANHVMRCLDLNIPPDNEEMARMCREILNTCIRNTEEAERANNPISPTESALGTPVVESGRGLGKGVWNMIEESELAKSLQRKEGKMVKGDVMAQARECKAQLEALLSRPMPSSTGSSTPVLPPSEVDPELIKRTTAVLDRLSGKIQTTEEPSEMEALLIANDELTMLLGRASAKPTIVSSSSSASLSSGTRGAGFGLGLTIPNGDASSFSSSSSISSTTEPGGMIDHGTTIVLNGNGFLHDEPEEDDDEPVTPRLDKGKRRAEPEPEEPEKILSPSPASYAAAAVAGSDTEDEEEEGRREFLAAMGVEDPLPSPNDRSRSWVEEEGEVFRKGAVLLGPEELEGDFAGEELRQELLQAEVERPPPRPIGQEEYGFTDDIVNNDHIRTPTSPMPLSSPVPPSAGSPHGTPEQQYQQPAIRPYAVRTRSSSSSSVTTLSSIGSGASGVTAGATLREGEVTPTPSSPMPSPTPSILRPAFLRKLSSASNDTQ